jgi:hypothetical protein
MLHTFSNVHLLIQQQKLLLNFKSNGYFHYYIISHTAGKNVTLIQFEGKSQTRHIFKL